MPNQLMTMVVHETTTTRTIWREATFDEIFGAIDPQAGFLVPQAVDHYDDGVWVRHRLPAPPRRWTTNAAVIFLFGLLLGHLLTGI